MTNEKRLEAVYSMLRAYDAISGGVMGRAEDVIKNPQAYNTNSSIFRFYADAAALIIEARQGMDKKTTGSAEQQR